MAESVIKYSNVQIRFGDSGPIADVLTTYWQTKIPNDGLPHLVDIGARYGSRKGYLCRYDGVYGSGLLTTYDGTFELVTLNEGTVTVRSI